MNQSWGGYITVEMETKESRILDRLHRWSVIRFVVCHCYCVQRFYSRVLFQQPINVQYYRIPNSCHATCICKMNLIGLSSWKCKFVGHWNWYAIFVEEMEYAESEKRESKNNQRCSRFMDSSASSWLRGRSTSFCMSYDIWRVFCVAYCTSTTSRFLPYSNSGILKTYGNVAIPAVDIRTESRWGQFSIPPSSSPRYRM